MESSTRFSTRSIISARRRSSPQAGRKGAVTIATNMAGRGTDIVLGGNPEAMAWAILQEKYETRLDVPQDEWDALVDEIESREQMKPEGREVAGLGGLHIIGTERHEARRIDLQLRGRCGRQGDPGSSRFFLSLEDDLMRIFAGEWVKNILTRLGMKEGEAIESRMVSRRIEGAQKKVEERNFEIRKSLLEYDEVMDEQRKRVYGYRQAILHGIDCRGLIFEMIEQEIDRYLEVFLDKDYGTGTFAKWAGDIMSVEFEPRDFRGLDFERAEAFAKDEAERLAESQVFDLVEENLPEDSDPDDWNWGALAKAVDVRWRLSLRDRDLKKIGRDDVAEFLIDKARESIGKTDLSAGEQFLDTDYGLRSACAWVDHKFDIKIDWDHINALPTEEVRDEVQRLALEAYRQREVEYPVLTGLLHHTLRDASGHKRYDRESLADWAKRRFHVEFTPEELKNKQREQIRGILVEKSREYYNEGLRVLDEANERVDAFLAARDGDAPALAENAAELALWAKKISGVDDITGDELVTLDDEIVRRRVVAHVDQKYRTEMRFMERALVLQLLDAAWKEHLLVMDHLRSGVGLRGYAQVDPKVEYKREGMRTFERMWDAFGERVTDLVFKMEQLDERFIGSTWSQAEAIHEEAPSADQITEQQQAAIDGTQSDRKLEPIRNRSERVGRNSPCPCGSGKKYKNCCMKR